MSKALPGTHLCAAHQGNHSHYAPHNCEICKLSEEVKTLKGELALWQNPNRSVIREMAALVAENKTLRDGLRVYQTQLEKDTNESDLHALMRQGVEIAELKAENKTLRDALCKELVDDLVGAVLHGDAAIKWSDHEPN